MADLKWGNIYEHQVLKMYIINVILFGTHPPLDSQFTNPLIPVERISNPPYLEKHFYSHKIPSDTLYRLS